MVADPPVGMRGGTYIETDHHPNATHNGVKRSRYSFALLGTPRLSNHWAPLNFHVEQMQLLIPPSDFSILVNPDQGILHLLLSAIFVNATFIVRTNVGWLVNANANGQAVFLSLFADPENKRGRLKWLR